MATSSVLAPSRILLVDDNDRERFELAEAVAALGYLPEIAANGEEALEKLGSVQVDAIVTDLNMPRMDGFRLLKTLIERGDFTPAIVLTGVGGIRTALSAMHDLRAFWFLEKPARRQVLGSLLERAIHQKRLLAEKEHLHRQLSHKGMLGDLIGISEPMRKMFSLIQQVAPTSAPVLITGESGTGKELVAATIHKLSPRAVAPFVAINCAALPESLLESELFGHEKGAFTGALERKSGCFEQAHKGTLLLDEIGEMSTAAQSRFLRVLESAKVRRLGSAGEVPIDVRVLASTNRVVADAIAQKLFREDLYYRLNTFHIHIPPLRERREDIPLLATALIHQLNKRHGCRIVDLDSEAQATLMDYAWPGNIRELRNVLERSVIMVREGTISASKLRLARTGQEGASAQVLERNPPSEDAPGFPLEAGRPLRDVEASYIQYVVKQTSNRRKAAAILGISVRSLYMRLAELPPAEDPHSQTSAKSSVG